MDRDGFIVVVLVLALGSLLYTCSAQADCSRDGGVLIKDVWGFPECVKGAR